MSTTVKTGFRWALADATEAAQELITLLADYCERIEKAGSIGRGKASVKDIELVVIPKVREVKIAAVAGQMDLFGNVVGGAPASVRVDSLLDAKLHELDVLQKIFKVRPHTYDQGPWGERQKKFWVKWGLNGKTGYIPVDMFIVRPPAQWGSIFTIRTGPDEFVKALMGYINSMTPYKQMDGRLVRKDDETVEVQTPEEHDYFKALGLRMILPNKRTAEALREQVRFSRFQEQQRIDKQKREREQALTPQPPLPHGEGEKSEDGKQSCAGLTSGESEEKQPSIKAITLHQPWASLIAAGFKQFETRSWPTNYRGLLAIHAGKTTPAYRKSDLLLTSEQWAQMPDPLPLGTVVAIVRLVDVSPTEQLEVSALERSVGNFARGRYGWKLEVVTVFDKPIQARGQQGLWDWFGWDGVIGEEQTVNSQPQKIHPSLSISVLDHPRAPSLPSGLFESATAKSATVADLTVKKDAENIPVGGEQVSAPLDADPNGDILSVRIRQEIARLPGVHPTVIFNRLNIKPEDASVFRMVLKTLHDLGYVRENRYGGLWLAEDTNG